MHSSLSALGLTLPVLAAPMAGGPGRPQLAIAAAGAGSLGFVAGGYKTTKALAVDIRAVRETGVAFGVNLFAPNPVPIDEDTYESYRRAIQDEAGRYAIDLDSVPRTEHDDQWAAKVDLLLADPVPLASFTFGIPDSSTIAALRKVGTVVAQTVTSAPEARLAAAAGADVLIVQASAAGGHSGTLTPDRIPIDVPLPQLLGEIGSAVTLPMIGGGGIGSPADVAAALAAGASAVVVGTALLLSPESGASAAHRAGLADPRRGTVVTRAFTGRPARGLRNRFTDRFTESAPTGYPAVHYLTSPLRKAAAAAADPEVVNLWAGTGYRQATAAPAAKTLAALAAV